MIKVKEFLGTTSSPIEEKVNNFIRFANAKREIIDVKYIPCDPKMFKNAIALALLIYREESE